MSAKLHQSDDQAVKEYYEVIVSLDYTEQLNGLVSELTDALDGNRRGEASTVQFGSFEAYIIVSAYSLMTSAGYMRAMEELELRYGNTELIATKSMTQVLQYPSV